MRPSRLLSERLLPFGEQTRGVPPAPPGLGRRPFPGNREMRPWRPLGAQARKVARPPPAPGPRPSTPRPPGQREGEEGPLRRPATAGGAAPPPLGHLPALFPSAPAPFLRCLSGRSPDRPAGLLQGGTSGGERGRPEAKPARDGHQRPAPPSKSSNLIPCL